MEELVEEVQRLDVDKQRWLLVELLSSHQPDTQLSLLTPVLSAAPGYVKWRVTCLLNTHIMPDLVSLLPPELQLAVLSYVDGISLLNACRVSHNWCSLIGSHQQLWSDKCRHLGINLSPAPPWPSHFHPLDWQRVYVGVVRQSAALKCGRAFSQRWMHLHNCTTPIKAVDYKEGYLCTVSEADQVTIWHLGLNVAVLTFSCQRTVSCLCLHPASLLLCGHFTGMLTSWDLSAMPRPSQSSGNHKPPPYPSPPQAEPGALVNKFKMHAGPVFSCDFSEELDVMVSGGADECLKLWSLSSGLVLHSLAFRDHWVLRVKLLPASTSSTLPDQSAKHRVIYMTRQRVSKLSWPAVCKQNCVKRKCTMCEGKTARCKQNGVQAESGSFEECFSFVSENSGATSSNSSIHRGGVTQENTLCKSCDSCASGKVTIEGSVGDSTSESRNINNSSVNTASSEADSQVKRHGILDKISEDGSIDLNYSDHGIFTPGLQLSSKHIALVQQDLDEKSAKLFLFDINTLAPIRTLALWFKVKKLLALGNRYALLLTPGSMLYSSTLTVLDVVTGEEAGSSTVPHSKMTTPDGAQIVVGETGWLDGLGPHLPQPPLALAPSFKHRSRGCTSCKSNQPGDCDSSAAAYNMSSFSRDGRACISACVGTCEGGCLPCTSNSHSPVHTSVDVFCGQHQKCASQGGTNSIPLTNLKLGSGGHLVLAAGVQTEPGRLFTLWWAEAGMEEKHKKE
ncbi:hypothetical protein Pcinc_041528 [Petrolisthes cinctipes]|uniref:F-box domain-containing protein n=1 Tax=Petrolisthes cinctipes TaxID=88211 RepID=A0AAE1EHQ3_PETCI|nr:hypothetical protein Pcinc_041528 [Petrolisthes cinctipes]